MDPTPSPFEDLALWFESGDADPLIIGVLAALLAIAYMFQRDRAQALEAGHAAPSFWAWCWGGGLLGSAFRAGWKPPEAPKAEPEAPPPQAATPEEDPGASAPLEKPGGPATTAPLPDPGPGSAGSTRLSGPAAHAPTTTGSVPSAHAPTTTGGAPAATRVGGAPAPSSPGPLPAWVRTTLEAALGGRYGEYALLGAGGMGTVVRARDHKLERLVAIKLPPPQLAAHAEFRERFLREARALARLNHPAIGGVHDVPDVPEGEIPVMVLEYLEGEDLGAWLERHGPGPVDQVLAWISQAASGLAHAHARGVLHRDVKPSNLMLVEGQVRLLDFGLAGFQDASKLTTTGMIMGSLPYMPPEQLRGEPVSEAADQYSLAASAFELLTGRPPFDAEDRERTAVPAASPLRAGLTPELDAALRRGLAPDPAARFAAIEDLAAALRAAA